jgi:hypothetical protein
MLVQPPMPTGGHACTHSLTGPVSKVYISMLIESINNISLQEHEIDCAVNS